MEKYVITLSRQFASLGRTIAHKISDELDIEFYDRDIVEATAKRMGLAVSVISNEEENAKSTFFKRMYPLGMGVANMQDEIYQVQSNIIQDLVAKKSCIIVGRNAQEILKDHPRCLNIYISAPYEARLKNCTEILGMDAKNAKMMIHSVDKARENYRIRYTKDNKSIVDAFDIVIDSSKFGTDKTAEIIIDIIKDLFY